jgi:SAM-dependent methyltransferase
MRRMTAALRSYGRRVLNLTRRVANRVLGPSTSGAMLAGLAELRGELATTRGEVARIQETVRSLRNEVAGQISFLVHDLGAQLNEVAGQTRLLSHDLGAQLNEVAGQTRLLSHDLGAQLGALAGAGTVSEAEVQRLQDRLAAIESVLLTRLNEINQYAFEGRNAALHIDTSVHSRLNDLFFVQLPAMLEQLHQVAVMLPPNPNSVAGSGTRETRVAQPLPEPSFEQALERARRDFPTVYEAWKLRLDAMSDAFAVTKEGNAAHGGDLYSHLFRRFVAQHARGPLLDVGCGPFGMPYYLQDYPGRLFAGLEPLPMSQVLGLTVVRGISEYLPWPDRCFDTLISATSLDHCLSLDRSLNEVRRVLRPDGCFLLWIGSNPGAPPYRPLDPAFEPADQFHLFHFDIAWFEPLLARHFETIDRVKLDRAGYSHVFYCLRPLQIGDQAKK